MFKRDKFEDLNFPKSIEVNGIEFEIEVNFSKKRNSSATIKDQKLIFRMSSYLTRKDAISHFGSLLKSLSKKIEKNPVVIKTFQKVLEDGFFYFGGEKFLLEYSNKVRSIKLENNIFLVKPNQKVEIMEKRVVKLLIERYESRLEQYVRSINNQSYKFQLNGFSLKLSESKWGHCSHDDKIMLNLKLLNANTNVLNYVIYHELAHIRHKNHSDNFWQEVQRFCPNHKILRKNLKLTPPNLFR